MALACLSFSHLLIGLSRKVVRLGTFVISWPTLGMVVPQVVPVSHQTYST